MSNEARITVRIPLHVEEFLKEDRGASWVRETLIAIAEGRVSLMQPSLVAEVGSKAVSLQEELAAKTQECELLAAKVRDLEEKLAARMRVQTHGSLRKEDELPDNQKVAKLAANDKPVDPSERERIAQMIARTVPGSGKKAYVPKMGKVFTPKGK